MIRTNRLISLACLFLLMLPAAGGMAQIDHSSGVFLGPPPVFPDRLDQLLQREPELDLPAALTVDPADRENSRTFFFTNYQNAVQPAINWTGDVDTCSAGTTAAAFKDAVILRINYFRAMAGVPAAVSWSSTYSTKDQKAALMMAANSALDHTPPSSWECYSADGADGAGNSNLALGEHGWDAISLYIKDPGAGNEFAGHRRWLLYPQTQLMGTGDIPADAFYTANAVWVFDDNIWGPRPATREAYVAWPPPGYVPYPVVYPRWSFAYAEASFTQAAVTVTRGGQSVPVTIQPYATGYGENTLVWIMNNMSSWDNWPQPGSDEAYQVTVQNVMIAGSPHNFSYTVTVFDPDQQVCQYSVTPLSAAFPAAGGTGSAAVTAAAGCDWTASSNRSWIQIVSGETGSGDGAVEYRVTANTTLVARSGTVTVAGKTVAIDQQARAGGSLGWLLLLTEEP